MADETSTLTLGGQVFKIGPMPLNAVKRFVPAVQRGVKLFQRDEELTEQVFEEYQIALVAGLSAFNEGVTMESIGAITMTWQDLQEAVDIIAVQAGLRKKIEAQKSGEPEPGS